MMLTTHVEICLTGSLKAKYRSLGYNVDLGKALVKVEHLSKCSKMRVLARCYICGKERNVYYTDYKDNCLDCTRKSFSGKNNPAWNGGKNKCAKCGELTSGWTQTVCGKCHLQREQSGQMNPAWTGGKPKCSMCGEMLSDHRGKLCRKCFITSSKKEPTIKRQRNKSTKSWTSNVLSKANYTCDICGGYNKDKLVAHHLNGFDNFIEDRFNIDNGVCLCRSCHMKFHKAFGFGNNTADQYYKFKEAKI